MKTNKEYREMRKAEKARSKELDKEYFPGEPLTEENKKRLTAIIIAAIACLVIWIQTGLL